MRRRCPKAFPLDRSATNNLLGRTSIVPTVAATEKQYIHNFCLLASPVSDGNNQTTRQPVGIIKSPEFDVYLKT